MESQGRGDESSSDPPSRTDQQATLTTVSSVLPERRDLIELATKFLSNPRVQGNPMEQKRAFLKNKKGLTDAEIDKAIELAKAVAPTAAMTTSQPSNQIVPPPLPPRPPSPPPQSRGWQDYAVMALVIGGVGYTVVQFVRHYVIPWLESPRVQEEKMEDIRASVQQLQSSVSETVASVNESTKAIRDLLSEQHQQLQELTSQVTALRTHTPLSQEHLLKEIKEEMSSLKGLMVNRHQFPTPGRQGSIPDWQKAANLPATPIAKPLLQNGLEDSNPPSGDSSNGSPPQHTHDVKTQPPADDEEWKDAVNSVN